MIAAYKIDIDLGLMLKNFEQRFTMRPDQIIGNLQFDNLNYSRDHKCEVAAIVEYTKYMKHALFLRFSRNPAYYTLTLFVPNTVLTTLRLVKTGFNETHFEKNIASK